MAMKLLNLIMNDRHLARSCRRLVGKLEYRSSESVRVFPLYTPWSDSILAFQNSFQALGLSSTEHINMGADF
jgi:hypothetical protein